MYPVIYIGLEARPAGVRATHVCKGRPIASHMWDCTVYGYGMHMDDWLFTSVFKELGWDVLQICR